MYIHRTRPTACASVLLTETPPSVLPSDIPRYIVTVDWLLQDGDEVNEHLRVEDSKMPTHQFLPLMTHQNRQQSPSKTAIPVYSTIALFHPCHHDTSLLSAPRSITIVIHSGWTHFSLKHYRTLNILMAMK
uniref:Uncharacterized protein n=1 Tax=Panagrellus redivivus TaxID=6233 RepID=A0A7E4ZRP7_PANRE